jgi:hypothetical protein
LNKNKKNRPCAGFFSTDNRKTWPIQSRYKYPDEKKPARRPVFSLLADYLAGVEAAGAEAAGAAASEAAGAAAAGAAASEAAGAAAAGAGVASAGAGAGATTGAGAGASSFLLQAAKATANREMISKDFFMGFP